MSRPKPPTYRTTNWHDYKAALAKRGSLSIWFDPGTQWLAAPTGKRGRQPVFTDAAIQACLTLKALFGLPLRQTTGMVASLLDLAGLDWPGRTGLAGLDFSTLCRRHPQRAGPPPSSRPAETASLGRNRRRGRLPLSSDQWRTMARCATMPFVAAAASVERSGSAGPATTDEVWSKPRCGGFKLLDARVMPRDFERQVAELQIRAAILNRFTALGTPRTQRAK